MAANTVSAWTKKTLNNRLIMRCTILFDTANQVGYTKMIPAELDMSKPWVMSTVCDAAIDGQAVPTDIYMSLDGSTELAGTASVTASANYAHLLRISDDGGYSAPTVERTYLFLPNYTGANDVTFTTLVAQPINCPPVPRIFIVFNGATTLAAQTITITIVQ
jgi:hypothetical protein